MQYVAVRYTQRLADAGAVASAADDISGDYFGAVVGGVGEHHGPAWRR